MQFRSFFLVSFILAGSLSQAQILRPERGEGPLENCGINVRCVNNDDHASFSSSHAQPAEADSKPDPQVVLDPKSSIDCSVMSFDGQKAQPVLHLLCPPAQVFAPLRVYLTLSWKTVSEIPREVGHFLVRANSLAQLKVKPDRTQVKLEVASPGSDKFHGHWVDFTELRGIGLVKDKR